MGDEAVRYEWRGSITNDEVNALHAEAFEHRVFGDDWLDLLGRFSLGWVNARDDLGLVGFVNVIWDGLVHAFVEDTVVAARARRRGIGVRLIDVARDQAAAAGCEWLHVDFEDHLRGFYLEACGFTPTAAGLVELGRRADARPEGRAAGADRRRRERRDDEEDPRRAPA